jgi:hypothetical protein
MGKKQRVLFDTNVWSYLSCTVNADVISKHANAGGKEILVSPTVISELREIGNTQVRLASLNLATDPRWVRLMPEAFSECAELKRNIRILHPEWFFEKPKMAEMNRVRYDWVRRGGGFWERARKDLPDRVTDESVRADRELMLARKESNEIRKRTTPINPPSPSININEIGGVPPGGEWPGYEGRPVAYWRIPGLIAFRNELLVYTSPYREWLDCEINVPAMFADPSAMNRMWLYHLDPVQVPRQWLRGAFEFLQAWHKVTPGTPGDASLSTHLIESDVVVSADKNFVRFAERCHREAPFASAKPHLVRGGSGCAEDILTFLSPL